MTSPPDPALDLASESPVGESKANREETDVSLRVERETADGAGQAQAIEDDADRVLELARTRADAILAEARAKADHDPEEALGPDQVARDRAAADEDLEYERAVADERLRREREDSARVLSALLPLERMSTDGKLLTERATSDAALSYRDDFLGMVSHDLNNLLSGIVLSAGTLCRQDAQTPAGKRVAAKANLIQLYAARMKRLIGDLTDVTSLTAGKLGVNVAVVDGRALVAEALASFQQIATEKGLTLELDAPDAPLYVLCDRGRMLQVLTNLLGNAVKFTPTGGRVSARALSSGGDACFSVTDTGCGIPTGRLEDVFERFWQAGKDDRRGLGLGLYIAKSIVEAHGGRIWAESRTGEGCTVRFLLPTGVARPPVAPATTRH